MLKGSFSLGQLEVLVYKYLWSDSCCVVLFNATYVKGNYMWVYIKEGIKLKPGRASDCIF